MKSYIWDLNPRHLRQTYTLKILDVEQQLLYTIPLTAVSTDTRPRCWNLSFRKRQSTVSMVFSRAPTKKGRAKTYKNNFDDTGVFNFYFIKMKDYIAKTTRSLPTDWNSRNSKVNVKVFKLFIYLIVWKHGSRGRIAKEHKFRETKYIIVSHKGKKFPPEWRLFWKKKRIF